MGTQPRGPKAQERTINTPLKGIPDPPFYLDDDAKEHFVKTANLLFECGNLSLLDTDALAMYATHYARWRKAEDVLTESYQSEVVTLPNKTQQSNPWLNIANEAMKQMKSYLSEFGLSPKARQKLIMPEADEDDDGMSEYL